MDDKKTMKSGVKKLEDIHALAIKRFKESYEHDMDDRANAREDLTFGLNLDGSQWPDEIRDAREKDPSGPRPCLTLNKIPEKVDIIDGEFRQSEPSATVVPVDSKADVVKADIVNGILRHTEYSSRARAVYNRAFTSLLYTGRCAWQINTRKLKENPFVKEIVIEPIPDVFTVYYDPMAKLTDRSDSRYFFITTVLSKEEYRAKYGECEDDFAEGDAYDLWRVDGVRIAKYWWKDVTEEKVHMVERADPLGNGVQLIVTEDQLKDDDRILDSTTQEVVKVYYGFITGSKFIKPPTEWPCDKIPIVFGTAKSVYLDGKHYTRGMIREAKEPQRMLNYWGSCNTEQLALAPKVPFMVTPTMVENYESMWNTLGSRNWPYVLYNPDPTAPGGAPQRQAPPVPSSGIINEMAKLEHDIMSAMGVYRASLGDSSSEKSGKAILARQRQGNIGTYSFTDTMSVCMTYSAQLIVDLIPYVYDTERIQRIRGVDGTEKAVPINYRPGAPVPPGIDTDMVSKGEYINDLTVGKYDVRVKIGPSYTTQREESLTKMLQLLKEVPSAIPAVLDILVRNVDMPDGQELVRRIEQLVPPELRGGGQPGQGPMQQPPDPAEERKIIMEAHKMRIQGREQLRKELQTKAVAAKQFSEAEKISKEING